MCCDLPKYEDHHDVRQRQFRVLAGTSGGPPHRRSPDPVRSSHNVQGYVWNGSEKKGLGHQMNTFLEAYKI